MRAARFATIAVLALVSSCRQGTVDRVQPNLVDKAIFEGEWWVSQTVVYASAEASATGVVWPGDMAFADLGIDSGQSGTVARIRWVIDEEYLFAYRAYELVAGGNRDGNDPEFRGEPIAAFRIEDHVDVRREYNPITGERTNVVAENDTDRRWYERASMRVDWSKNLVRSFYFAAEDGNLGSWSMAPADFFVPEGADDALPRSWQPEFVRVGEDPTYRFRDEWPEGNEDVVHYMSFVTMSFLTPGSDCLFQSGGSCRTLAIPYRTSFLRVPPNHEYASATQSHEEFDRFGLFRTLQRTYVRGGEPRETLRNPCATDLDCGFGGYCDVEVGVCAGGLTDDLGETDLLVFYRPRHNLFGDSLTDATCLRDWECADAGDGSLCDRAARRCTVPVADRPARTMQYVLSAGYPAHLVPTAFEVVASWNEALMRGRRARLGGALPDYASARIACQTDDPTAYCHCGSVEDDGGTCRGRYDALTTPSEWQASGIAEPFRCHVENARFAPPARPISFGDYPRPDVYHFAFVGDECLLTLRANACDLTRADPAIACDDLVDAAGAPIAWEKPGDLRTSFFDYVDRTTTWFAGVAYPLADPTSGELVVANALVSAGAVERRGTMAIEFFPVLRCANETLGCDVDDQSAADRYLSGENVRTYFASLGRVEPPVGIAAAGRDGIVADLGARPAIPADLGSRLGAVFDARVARIAPLYGREGRASILSDRMRSLAGTRFETQLLSGLGSEGTEALNRHFDDELDPVHGIQPDATIVDDEVLDEVSPFRGTAFLRSLLAADRREQQLGARAICADTAALFRDRDWEYFAERFRGRPAAEAAIRMEQLALRTIGEHEMGHALGLRHNFAASLDRNQYGDGYFDGVIGDPTDATDDLALPTIESFDDPILGGDGDGFTAGAEVDAYLAELRRVRDERSARGVARFASSSVMDYEGDTSRAQGLGRYDVASVAWSYYDVVEGYVEDPVIDSTTSLDGLARSHEVGREWLVRYNGGEVCNVDADCPYSDRSGRLVPDQAISQRCVRNSRETLLQEPCGGAANCICSSFDLDFDDFVEGAAYPVTRDRDNDGEPDLFPVRYRFCPDERTNDISWCTRWDSGESFQEVIEGFRRDWRESYPSRYYRRFRRGGPEVGGAETSIRDAAKIYQHLFFRAFNEPGFRRDEGPLGFDDQFMASVSAMNWLAEMATLPDEGAYAYEPAVDRYDRIGVLGTSGSLFELPPGLGFSEWTEYQDGYFGFFREERSGVYYDKYFALYALAIRDWQLSFSLDERYFVSFYDLFPTEMTELFGGLVIDDPHWFAPRVRMVAGEPVVQSLSWYRGTTMGECEDAMGRFLPCRGSQPVVYPDTPLGDTSNVVLRSWAAILALAQFPVFYDTTFEQRLLVFKAGSGQGFAIPTVQPDGTPTCVYGSNALGAGYVTVDDAPGDGCDTPDDADVAVFESSRLNTPYVAVKVRTGFDYNLEEEQLGFQLLRRLVDLQDDVAGMPAGPDRDALLRELIGNESFLEYLLELQVEYGISNTFF